MRRAPPIASSSACIARSACAPRWAVPTACRAGGTRPARPSRADLSLTVPIPVGEGFNFAMAEAMVDCGRRTARERLPQIRLAMQQVLAPGVP